MFLKIKGFNFGCIFSGNNKRIITIKIHIIFWKKSKNTKVFWHCWEFFTNFKKICGIINECVFM